MNDILVGDIITLKKRKYMVIKNIVVKGMRAITLIKDEGVAFDES